MRQTSSLAVHQRRMIQVVVGNVLANDVQNSFKDEQWTGGANNTQRLT